MTEDLTPGPPLTLAAGPVTTDREARTISGRVVPFGPAGQTTAGILTFTAGSLRWAEDVRRVKLLREHDQRDVVGFATALDERADGLYATFTVPDTEAGNRALAEARDGLRDAFSVGTQLDHAVAERLRRGTGGAIAATGALREVSLVSVPAFDDARVDSVAASGGALTVSAWTDPPLLPDTPDPEPEPEPVPPTDPQPNTGEPAVTVIDDVTEVTQADASGPVTVRAAAGAAVVTGSPATYTFSSDSAHGLLQDAARAQSGDGEAGARLARFNAEIADGNQASQLALAAVLVRDPVPDSFFPTRTLPAISTAINAGRPLASRLTRVAIANAQPFAVPLFGGFTGVGLHTEGTPHVAEGVLTLGSSTVQPTAVSGAYRMSRELADSSSPALDAIAIQEMVAEYQATSEGRIAAAIAAGAGVTTGGVTSVMDLRAELIATLAASDRPADFVAAGSAFYAGLAQDVDTTGRPFLSYAPAVNSPAAALAGYTGANVDGVDVVPASRIAAGEAFALRKDAVMFAESEAQRFRLEQPEGPGIIKLAIFGYVAAHVLKPAGVRRLTIAA